MANSNDDVLVVLCTAPSSEVATKLARGLVEGRYAACVNIVTGVRSIYRWKGQVHDEPEVQLFAKTTRFRFDALARYVRENHPAEVPEILALEATEGLDPYLAWVATETTEGDGGAQSP